jgi:hypothetical protein
MVQHLIGVIGWAWAATAIVAMVIIVAALVLRVSR